MQDALTEAAMALAVEKPSCPEAATDCVFCDIVAGTAPAVIAYTWPDAVAFTPLNPVTVGHVLIVPRRHITVPHEDPELYQSVSGRAAVFAGMMETHYNLITNVGEEATQSIGHLHVHLIPRFHGDGLQLPWSNQYQPASPKKTPEVLPSALPIVIYDVSMRTITIKMEESLAGHLEHLANERVQSVSEVVRDFVRTSKRDWLVEQGQRSASLIDPSDEAEWDAWAASVAGKGPA
jgi:histidine triad (HIT) family protein